VGLPGSIFEKRTGIQSIETAAGVDEKGSRSGLSTMWLGGGGPAESCPIKEEKSKGPGFSQIRA
jgi:hypothetical protein